MILVLVATAVSIWRVNRQAHWIAREFPPIGKFLEVDGTRVHYVERGAGQPVILIHGLSSNVMEWDTGLLDAFAQDYRIIAFDRPGLGYTDPIDGVTLVAQAALLSKAAHALKADDPIVIGHSFGGAVALAWAAYRPGDISGLMVLSGASHPFEDLPQGVITLLGSAPLGTWIAGLQLAATSTKGLHAAEADAFAPQDTPADFVRDAGSWLKMRPDTAVENMRQLSVLNADLAAQVPLYPGIKIPVSVVRGTADGIVAYDANAVPLAQAIPGADLVTLDGLGHEPNVVSVEDVKQALLDLIARL
jgi:pimeloyl-ACP methyl ester carboxylesterase